MKKQSVMKTIGRFALYAAFSSLLSFSLPAHAQTGNDSPAVTIRYAGTIEQKPLFTIQFDNSSQQAYAISIIDDEGHVMYQEWFKGKKFAKSFLLDDDVDFENVQLSFVITYPDGNKTQVFDITKRSVTKEEYVITRR